MGLDERGVLVTVNYLGGSHGAFLKYFIDRFSDLTPSISESPFEENGTSHNRAVKYSGRVDRRVFEDVHGNALNNYVLHNKTKPNIVIEIDDKTLMNFTRMFFTRKSDHELTSTYISAGKGQTSVLVDENFVARYRDSFKLLFNMDIHKQNAIPISLMRDFLKVTFLDKKQNRTLTSMQKIKANLSHNDQIISLKDIWNTDAFIHRMQQISDALNLNLVLESEAVDLHNEFLSRRANHDTWNRVYTVIQAIKDGENMDCSTLDIVEQGYLSSWIEQNYDFIQTPLTRNFFSDTNEILEYVKYYPNYYKAMNPNLPKFNNIDNPFHLWAKNKSSK